MYVHNLNAICIPGGCWPHKTGFAGVLKYTAGWGKACIPGALTAYYPTGVERSPFAISFQPRGMVTYVQVMSGDPSASELPAHMPQAECIIISYWLGLSDRSFRETMVDDLWH
jgi:hypothetical protein